MVIHVKHSVKKKIIWNWIFWNWCWNQRDVDNTKFMQILKTDIGRVADYIQNNNLNNC